MDSTRNREETEEVLAKLEESLLRRIPYAYRLAPENLRGELTYLALVLEIKERLRNPA